MKIDRVVFCLNSSPTYSGMWDIVSEVYTKHTNIKPTLVFSGTEKELLDEVKKDFGEVFLLPKYQSVVSNPSLDWSVTWTAFWAMANLFSDEVCSFSGIDEIPISDKLWKKIEEVPDDRYVVGLGANPYGNLKHIASGHNCAKGHTFKSILEIEDSLEQELHRIWNIRNDLKHYISAWNAEQMSWWGLDEAYISSKLYGHDKVVFMNDQWVDEQLQKRKICRGSNCNYDKQKLKERYYWTAHMVRPLSDPNNLKKILQLVEDLEC